MTRIINASEVKPGMEVEFTVTRRMTIRENILYNQFRQEFRGDTGEVVRVGPDAPVTVLSEPTPPQPEEPRWVAARVKVGDRRFFRVDDSDRPWRKADHKGKVIPFRYSWSDICSSDTVTVIPDQGWTVPDTPEVPERIEEWPEDDTALRPYKWRDREGDTWTWAKAQAEWECHDDRNDYQTAGSRPSPRFAPFVRVTDA